MKKEIIYGKIEEGSMKGRKVILSPREGIPDNLYLVEKGEFMNGSPMFALHCLTKGCEKEVPGKCEKCNQ
jgi:hypothetical protein